MTNDQIAELTEENKELRAIMLLIWPFLDDRGLDAVASTMTPDQRKLFESVIAGPEERG